MKKLLVLAFITIGTALNVYAESSISQQKTVLTVDDAVSLALENNLSIKQSKLSLNLLEKKAKTSWNTVSPSLSASGGLSDSLPVNEGMDQTISYSVGASASIRVTPAVIGTIKSAKLAYETGVISYDSAVRSVEMSVRQAFYSLLNMESSIISNRETLEAAKRTFDSNTEKYERGRLDQLTLLNSQYNYESKIPTVESSINSYQNSMDSFKQILGINLTDEIELKGSLDDAINLKLSDGELKYDLESIPSIINIKQNIKSAETQLASSRLSSYGPSFSASYSYSGGGGIEPSSDFSTRGSSISLSVSLPLDSFFPWSSASVTIDSQKNSLENLKLQLENARVTAMINIKNSYNSILMAQTQLGVYEANYELMKRTYEMTLIAYNNGSKDLSTLQTAEDNLSKARFSLQSQKYTIFNAILNLENTLGIPFGTLNQVMTTKDAE